MFGIGIIEVFIVLMMALFVIGPDKIPEAAASVGRFIRSAKQYINELKRSVHDHPLKDEMRSLQDQVHFDMPELNPEDDHIEGEGK
ncbi:MAG: sec-independent protein translocase protein TatB [Alphaproteobacteria bacterium]|jgi:sec-independent protein translocase protein TatB